MEKQEYEKLLQKSQSGITAWKNLLNGQQKELVGTLFNASTISKIVGGKEKVGIDTLRNVCTHIEKLLNEHNIYWKPHLSDFQPAHEADLSKAKNGIFESITGIYEMFHYANEGGAILKNILQLKADGNVIIKGQWGNTYYGKAHSFLSNLVSINIHKTQSYDFYHQICFNIGNHLMAGGERVKRIFAISTTISLDNTFSANLRVLIRRHPSAISEPFCYAPDTPEWSELMQTYPNLIQYLNDTSILRQTKKVNEDF